MELAEECKAYRKRKRVPSSEEVITNSEEKRLRLDNERNGWSSRQESYEKEPVNRRNQGYVQLPPTSQIHHTNGMSNSNCSILDKLSVMQEHEDDFVPWDFPETLNIPDIILDQNVTVDDLSNTETAASMSWNSIPSESLVISTDETPHTTVSGISLPPTSGTHTLSTESGFPTFQRIPGSLEQTPQWEILTQSALSHCRQSIQANDRTFDPMGIGGWERTITQPQQRNTTESYRSNYELQPAIPFSVTNSSQLDLHTATPYTSVIMNNNAVFGVNNMINRSVGNEFNTLWDATDLGPPAHLHPSRLRHYDPTSPYISSHVTTRMAGTWWTHSSFS